VGRWRGTRIRGGVRRCRVACGALRGTGCTVCYTERSWCRGVVFGVDHVCCRPTTQLSLQTPLPQKPFLFAARSKLGCKLRY
jgi:hypothetical protein